MNEKQAFLNAWEREAATTLKVLRAFPPDQLDFRPVANARSARELAWAFVFDGIGGAQGVAGELKFPPPGLPPMPDTWRAVVGEVERACRVLAEAVRKTGEPQLDTTLKFLSGPKQITDMRRLDFFWFLLNDMIHHRGQFSVYLRMVGGKVPAIYGPSADEPWT